MPIHWGLFDLALHPWLQPIESIWSVEGLKLWSPTPGLPSDLFPGRELRSSWWRYRCTSGKTGRRVPVARSGRQAPFGIHANLLITPRRDGREAEGGGLLNRYRVKSSIEGSNPSLSANPIYKSTEINNIHIYQPLGIVGWPTKPVQILSILHPFQPL